MTLQGITEDEIANYLVHTPAFFERNAALLSSIQLTSPHGQRAVSLQERQMEMLRDKIRGTGKAHHGDDPPQPGQRGHCRAPAPLGYAPCCSPMTQRHPGRRAAQQPARPLPDPASRACASAGTEAHPLRADLSTLACAQAVSDDARSFAASLNQPYLRPQRRL